MDKLVGFPKNLPNEFKTHFVSAYNEVIRLKEENNHLRRQLYGQKSERYVEETPISTIGTLLEGSFNEAEKVVEQEDLKTDLAEEPETNTEKNPLPKKKRAIEKALPQDLPREVKIHDLTKEQKICPNDNTELVLIGEDVVEKLGIIPAQLKIVAHHYKKYACPCCESHVCKASVEPSIVQSTMAEPSLLAHIVTNKFLYSLPLYRQEMAFEQKSIELPRETLARWVISVGEAVFPLVKKIKAYLMSLPVLHADETPVQVLKGTGKAATSKTYMWVMASGLDGHKASYYEYYPGRSSEYACQFIGNYKGYLQLDGYDGYNVVCASKNIIRVGCWAHVRRKFETAFKVGSKSGVSVAEIFLLQIKKLFEIEHEIKDIHYDKRLEIRIEKSAPVVSKIRSLIDTYVATIPPRSKLGEAFGYISREWTELRIFLEDGRVSLSNNRVENCIRPFAVGRKNWLFADTIKGAHASAALYTLVICAKENDLNVDKYLEDVFMQLPKALAQSSDPPLDHLLPWNWNDPG